MSLRALALLALAVALPADAAADPFRTRDGRLVRDRAQWERVRRPELKRLFERFVYGAAPAPRRVRVERSAETPFAGRHRLRQLSVRVEGTRRVLEVALFLPAGPARAPVVVALNKCGNQALHADPALRVTRSWVHPLCRRMRWDGRGAQSGHWAVETVLGAGYGLATFHESDLEPDDPGGDGVRRDLAGDWGVLAAWAWGLSRLVDALERETGVDPARLVAYGHSRRGKAALLASAFDERFALAAVHQSGTGGMALSRERPFESVARVTADYPHWFAREFSRFAADPRALPVDQDLLVALVAPRPVLDTEGRWDLWADPDGALLNLRRAHAVHRFLGAPGLLGDGSLREDFAPGEAGTLAQHRRWTWHTMNAGYWRVILRFADSHLRRVK
ncbi:MAG: acetylxylan esterase [Elusimicrobiota bacterium]|nr:acetylxylan esterase [Elusimicrobiota bacterium]